MGYSFDGTTKRITLTAGTTYVSVRDLWSRWVDWIVISDNSKYLPAFTCLGGEDIDPTAGTKVPAYAFLQNGWKIKPQEANHTLSIGDGILLVGGGGDPFVNTTGSFVVRINYQQPVQAISFDSGGGAASGLTPTQEALLSQAATEASAARKVAVNKALITTNPDGSRSVFIYDDDQTTQLAAFDLNEDGSERTPA